MKPRIPTGFSLWGLVSVFLTFALPAPAEAITLPDGFSLALVASGLNGVTAMELAPDGRVFVCEQTGALRIVKNDRLLARPFVTVAVDSSWERGLLGVALDPAFPKKPYVYLHYVVATPYHVVATPYPHHRLSRFTAAGDEAVAGSEVILFEGDDQNQLGGGVKNGHQGGAIHFGKDGKLYVAIGDQTAGAPAQDLKTLQGKILRLNPDGTIPEDNPFYKTTTGKYRAIWALGLRNPFTFAFQPGTGRMFINDVGGANEEINEGFAGANYGWPTVDHGPTSDPRFRGPIHWYPESSITGGVFYNPSQVQFPREYVGKYFFADFKAGWIKTLDPDAPQKVETFATDMGLHSVLDLKVAADGSQYWLARRAWVRDREFRANTGVLYRVRYFGDKAPPYVSTEPRARTVPVGAPVQFQVKARGSGTLRHQWQRDGTDLPGATEATLTLPTVSLTDNQARFRCVVTSAFGQAISETALLTVRKPDDVEAATRTGGIAISPAPGTYTGPITVCLSGNDLHYTTDGREPSADSPPYVGPFAMRQSATVKARRFRAGKPEGETLAAAYNVKGDRPYGLPYREPVNGLRMPPMPEKVPSLLSQTGVFASLTELRPIPGFLPYDVNVPLWSDGAVKWRWIALPPGRRIGYVETGEWTFPAGTVLVKHFELPLDARNPAQRKRLETRLLVVDDTGNGYGVTYRWRPDGKDATLVTEAQSEEITVQTSAGPRKQTWVYPGRADCLSCHTPAAKFVLGVKARQLQGDFTYPATGVRDNQLRTWNYLGLFQHGPREEELPKVPRLVPLEDRNASLELRARSYLDANCAHCHRPGNPLRASFDARFDVPLARQTLIDAPTVSDGLGLKDPRVVAPGDVARSMLYQRMLRTDNYKMPHLAVNVPDQAALAVLREWIETLPADRPKKQPDR